MTYNLKNEENVGSHGGFDQKNQTFFPQSLLRQGEEALELFANNPFKVDLIQRKAPQGRGVCVLN